MSDMQHLRIDAVDVPRVSGRLGLCSCPGGRLAAMPGHDPATALAADVAAIRAFGAAGVVSLVEEHELTRLGVTSMPAQLRRAQLWWKHLPIPDMGVPDELFEQRWQGEGAQLRDTLRMGGHVVLHCWAGLGRTGTIAARLLVEFGMEPAAAILRVRHARPGSIQTSHQERYVLGLNPPPAPGQRCR